MDIYIATILTWPMTRVPLYFLTCWGQQLPVQNYQALYALMAIAFGGNGSTNFNLPDLRGRGMIGYGASPTLPAYNLGANGGTVNITLNALNMPTHTHATPPSSVTGSASGNLNTTSTASLSGSAPVTIPVNQGTNSNNNTPTASTNPTYLGGIVATGPAATLHGPFSSTGPSLPAASNLTGTASLTGVTASVPISATITSTLSNAQVAAGNTGPAGGGGPASVIPILNPYLAMNFIIATQGIWPSFD